MDMGIKELYISRTRYFTHTDLYIVHYILFGHDETETWALGLTGSQEKVRSCPNKTLTVYKGVQVNK
jgi:hypothetical protein